MKTGIGIAAGVLSLVLARPANAAIPIAPAAPAPNTTPDDPDTNVAINKLGDRMGVDVMVEGVGPFRFMVDSGANRTVVSRMLADRLGLPSEGPVDMHSMGGEARVDSVRITGLRLGGMETDPITAPVLDEANLGSAAILGIDALDGKRVVIDLAAGKMTIRGSTRRIESAGDGEIVVVAKRRHGQLILTNAMIGGQTVDAVIDSGSDVTVGNLAPRGEAEQTPPSLRHTGDIARRIRAHDTGTPRAAERHEDRRSHADQCPGRLRRRARLPPVRPGHEAGPADWDGRAPCLPPRLDRFREPQHPLPGRSAGTDPAGERPLARYRSC